VRFAFGFSNQCFGSPKESFTVPVSGTLLAKESANNTGAKRKPVSSHVEMDLHGKVTRIALFDFTTPDAGVFPFLDGKSA
jgi:hypothetical protein